MNRYFQFLCNIVGNRSFPHGGHSARNVQEYDLLLRQLHRIEFYSLVPNDDNRGEDGKKLREIFLDKHSRSDRRGWSLDADGNRCRVPEEDWAHMGSSSLPQGPCTILEMLIGLSIRIENELDGYGFAKSTSECFWMLLENLDLAQYNDHEWLENASDDTINYIIEVFLDRKYDWDGHGGLFPMQRTRKDQRNVEIWYQMAEYLLENYEF